MQNLFYFTGGGKADSHYQDTIIDSVDLKYFGHYITSEQKSILERIYGDGPIKVWGAVPGKQNTPTYNKMQQGDAVLVYKDHSFTYAATVSFKVKNALLAEHFWGALDSGNTWELIYFLKDVVQIELPVGDFVLAVGYASDWFPRGYGSIGNDGLERIKIHYGSVEKFIASLSEKVFSAEEEVQKAIKIYDAPIRPNEEEVAEGEAEKDADKIYSGLSQEEKRRRAVEIFNKLKEASKKQLFDRKSYTATRYERGPAGRAVKELYYHRCMVEGCGFTFKKKNGEYYAEAHHLDQLSEGGYDDPSNIVVLCPNHHRQFHYADVKKILRNIDKLVFRINGDEVMLRIVHV